MTRFLSLFVSAGLVCSAQQDQTPRIQEPPHERVSDRWLLPYRAPSVSPVSFQNSRRVDELIRSGRLYLSLQDAIALALENNLDLELQRFNVPIAATDVQRAKGGGTLRSVALSTAEAPPGVGSPGSPLLNTAATGVTPATNVVTSAADLTPLIETQGNLSVTGTTPLSGGPPIPQYDPALVGQLNWQHSTTQETNSLVAGTNALVSRNLVGNVSLEQGFSPGTQIGASFNNNSQNSNSIRSSYNPYTTSSLGLTVTQPLLRGFGIGVNRRFIRIAKNNEKVADLVFRQQIIVTVSGVIRLYYDLVSWNEDVRVKRETLALAEKLQADNEDQVRQGLMAPIEITRARAQVAAARQDLATSEGLLLQQELILKTFLTRRGTADPVLRGSRIVPTDPIPDANQEEIRPIQDYLELAYRNRPDLAQAGIQVENSEISLKGSRNGVLPQLDLVGIAANSGLAGNTNPLAATGSAGGSVISVPGAGSGTGTPVLPQPADGSYNGGYGSALAQIFRRNYPTYGIGLQLTLPLRNRVAIADVVRDELQVRQSQIRRQQLENQVRLEVEDALIVLNRTRAAYDAATQSRILQEQSLASEQEKYAAGLSTSFLVIQYQSYLAQARSTEVAAKSAYIKAKTALDRSLGMTLERNNVSFDDAMRGVVSRAPSTPQLP